MRGYFVPTLFIAIIVPSFSSARSDDLPAIDVRPICRGIASQSADPLGAGLKATFEECLKSEQGVREQLKREWPNFSTADKKHCVALATTGGESSNSELFTCLEMARDVRALRSAANTPSKASKPNTAKGPASTPDMPTVQPVPAGKTSQPTALEESSKAELDRMTRELERAKAEAQTARASEASAQKKLADAEAALQRAKEDAGRAWAEGERAKTDANAAREAEAAAKRKLADADAARVAAEGRELACSAAKTQPGFGARIRSWFGPKRPNVKSP